MGRAQPHDVQAQVAAMEQQKLLLEQQVNMCYLLQGTPYSYHLIDFAAVLHLEIYFP